MKKEDESLDKRDEKKKDPSLGKRGVADEPQGSGGASSWRTPPAPDPLSKGERPWTQCQNQSLKAPGS